jgi:chromosome segregation ATPase
MLVTDHDTDQDAKVPDDADNDVHPRKCSQVQKEVDESRRQLLSFETRFESFARTMEEVKTQMQEQRKQIGERFFPCLIHSLPGLNTSH